MFRHMCKSKIHRATVTEANLHYTGSITIDSDLLKAADMYSHEKVQVLNINNGYRLETYIIPGAPGSGVICLNGAAARWFSPGDKTIIISYGVYEEEDARIHEPKMVYVDEKNRMIKDPNVVGLAAD